MRTRADTPGVERADRALERRRATARRRDRRPGRWRGRRGWSGRRPRHELGAVSRVRPSLASSSSGVSPAAASASPAGRTTPRCSDLALAISPSARWASGARSPDAATEPPAAPPPGGGRGQHRAQPIGDLGARAAAAGGQDQRPQEQHGPGGVPGQRLADPGRVRADQVALQRAHLIGRDADLGQRAEPGVDP